VHDISGVAGVGRDGECGGRELFHCVYYRDELLYAGCGKYQRGFGASIAAEDYYGGGGVHDECGERGGHGELSDAELREL
jgi:hypothetical protein